MICFLMPLFALYRFELCKIPAYENMLRDIASYPGILIVFCVFYKCQHIFTKEREIGYVMQFVGRRTLDTRWLN